MQAHEGLEPSCLSSSSPTQTFPHDTLESVLYLFLRKYNAGCLVLLFLQVLWNNKKMKYLKCSNKAGFCYLIYYHVPIVNMKLLFCKPRTQFVLLLYINKDYWIKKILNLQINAVIWPHGYRIIWGSIQEADSRKEQLSCCEWIWENCGARAYSCLAIFITHCLLQAYQWVNTAL